METSRDRIDEIGKMIEVGQIDIEEIHDLHAAALERDRLLVEAEKALEWYDDNMYFSYIDDDDVTIYGSRMKAMIGVWKAATQ